jgi:hypothetical protein
MLLVVGTSWAQTLQKKMEGQMDPGKKKQAQMDAREEDGGANRCQERRCKSNGVPRNKMEVQVVPGMMMEG